MHPANPALPLATSIATCPLGGAGAGFREPRQLFDAAERLHKDTLKGRENERS